MRTSIQALLLAAAVVSTSMAYAASPACPVAEMTPKGDVSKAEFQKMSEEKFDLMDTNKDGVLTVEERRAAREHMRANCGRKGKGHHASAPMMK
jgi:hypothetical protein